jgi:hypothetical protein
VWVVQGNYQFVTIFPVMLPFIALAILLGTGWLYGAIVMSTYESELGKSTEQKRCRPGELIIRTGQNSATCVTGEVLGTNNQSSFWSHHK